MAYRNEESVQGFSIKTRRQMVLDLLDNTGGSEAADILRDLFSECTGSVLSCNCNNCTSTTEY